MAYAFGGPVPSRERFDTKLPAAFRDMPLAHGGRTPHIRFEFLEQRHLGGNSGGDGGVLVVSSGCCPVSLSFFRNPCIEGNLL